jgi:uncharacterized membrane protein YfcA
MIYANCDNKILSIYPMLDIQYIIAGAMTGLVVGITGVGGGALMTPILLLFFGVSPTTAIATDLWFAALTKIAGALVHHRSGQVDWQVVIRLWTGSLPAALIIVVLVSSGTIITKLDWLTKSIGLLIIITALGLFFAPKLSLLATQRRLTTPKKFKALQPALTVISGALIGICVSLTSVGAGALGSLLLLYLYPLRMHPHKLVATDIMHAIPLALVAGLGYLIAGKVDGQILLNLLIGSVPSVIVGSLLAKKLSSRSLQLLLGCILFIVSIKLII